MRTSMECLALVAFVLLAYAIGWQLDNVASASANAAEAQVDATHSTPGHAASGPAPAIADSRWRQP